MLKIIIRTLVIGVSVLNILLSSALNAKEKSIITEELLSESELPLSVKTAWANTLAECTNFDGDLIETFGGMEIAVGQLSEYKTDVKLYLLPCGSPGAYNFPHIGIYYYPNENLAQVASLPILGVDGPTTTDVVLNASWDMENRQLNSYYKGRGVGDCGTSAIWEWNKTSADSAFILIEQRTKDKCDGVTDEWPLVWPIR